jgi:hypothetical protein
MFENAEVIHRYTRADAIRDGILVDVSEAAREAGFKWPVALTAAAWGRCVAVPPGVLCQDEAGRLWDVLTMLRCSGWPSAAATGRKYASQSTSATTTGSGRRRWSNSRHSAAPAMTAHRASPSCCRMRVRRVTMQVDPFRRKEEFERNTDSWAIELTRRGNPKGTGACS